MKYIIAISIFLLILGNIICRTPKELAKKTSTEICKQNFQIIKPAQKEELKEFISLMRRSKEKIRKESFVNFDYLEDYETYIVDINNDNKKEYVFVGSEGSGGYIALYIFIQINNEIKVIKKPKELELDWQYINPLTKSKELFGSAQNQIYIFGTSSNSRLTRNIYLWKNNKIEQIRDKF